MSWGVGVSCWCDPAISRCWGVTDCCTVMYCDLPGKVTIEKTHVVPAIKVICFFFEGELLLIMIGLITVVCRGWVGSLTVICRFDLFTLVLHTFVYVFVWICCYFTCLFIFWNCLTLMCIINSWFLKWWSAWITQIVKYAQHIAYVIVYTETERERESLVLFSFFPHTFAWKGKCGWQIDCAS